MKKRLIYTVFVALLIVLTFVSPVFAALTNDQKNYVTDNTKHSLDVDKSFYRKLSFEEKTEAVEVLESYIDTIKKGKTKTLSDMEVAGKTKEEIERKSKALNDNISMLEERLETYRKIFIEAKNQVQQEETQISKTVANEYGVNISKPNLKSEGDEIFTEKVGKILGIINVLGVLIAVITLMAMGIKYMVGSVEEKAANKKALFTWLIGAILVLSVTSLPNIIYNITKNLNLT